MRRLFPRVLELDRSGNFRFRINQLLKLPAFLIRMLRSRTARVSGFQGLLQALREEVVLTNPEL
jgi:hypothetical protein